MNLNTQQIILLCLLVSFVTSIATGIVTVSLLEQAPEPVAQTINRVVERTIERVVESNEDEDKTPVEQTPKRIIETVVVNQEDLTVEAVAKNSDSLEPIFLKKRDEDPAFATLGLAVSPDTLIADKKLINPNNIYLIKTRDGELEIDFDTVVRNETFAIFRVVDKTKKLNPVEFGDSTSLQLAQTVIALGGSSADTVSVGIINKFLGDGGSNTGIVTAIDATGMVSGSLLLNLQGKVVGIKTFVPGIAGNIFMPINSIKSFLAANGI